MDGLRDLPQREISNDVMRACRKTASVLVGLTALVAVAVLVGWFFNIQGLKSVFAGAITMKANTAISFLLLCAAFALALDARKLSWRRLTVGVLCLLVALISLLTLAEYLLSQNFKLDELLFADIEGAGGRFPPGRLAPVTALNFIFLSVALWLSTVRAYPSHKVSQAIALIPLLSGLQVVLGYSFGQTYLFGNAFYTQMALHTAFGFIFLSASFILARPYDGFVQAFTSDLPSSGLSRRLFAASVLSPILVHVLVQVGVQHHVYDADFATLIIVMGSITLISILNITAAYGLYRADVSRFEAQQKALQANTAKTNFLANISHEIRTPLGAVLGYSEILSSTSSETERSGLQRSIKRNTEHLLGLVNDVLEISKLATDKTEINRLTFSLPVFLNQLIVQVRARVRDAELSLTVNTDATLPLEPTTDPVRLKQALMNVIGNAIKFTAPQGSIAIAVSYRALPQSRLVFSISDSGIGITADQETQLFQLFSQGDDSFTRKFGGFGIGLGLAKHLMTALGGDLRFARPASGVGSTFVVEIDPGLNSTSAFGRIEIDRDPTSTSISSVTSAAASQSSQSIPASSVTLHGARILLVEDSPDNQILIKRYLTAAGADVVLAKDGVEGVEKAINGQFDLVLMDIQMPNLDGFGALAKLQEAGYDVPVVALTAHALESDREKSLTQGFLEHVTKPVDKKTLIEVADRFRKAR